MDIQKCLLSESNSARWQLAIRCVWYVFEYTWRYLLPYREMLTALDPMLESTPPPPPSLSDGGAQSPYLTHTNGYDQDNYIEQLEHLQRRLGAGE